MPPPNPGKRFADEGADMIAALLHAAPSAHSHPDQMAVAVVFAAAVVTASWVLQRRRS